MSACSRSDDGAIAGRVHDAEAASRTAHGAVEQDGGPQIAVVYVYPVGIPAYDDAARRFVSTYREFAPLEDHVLHVFLNGEGACDEHRAVFDGVPCVFHLHDNTGWDIGAFQQAASQIECDLIVCFGAFTYFKREGWLHRMSEAFQERGPGLYGASASYWFTPHIRTAGFWCHPELIRAYPQSVRTYAERYEFEHGATSITSFAGHLGLGCWMVTWDRICAEDEWRTPPDIFWRGDQSNSLCYDRRFDTYDEHPLSQAFFAAAADGWDEDPRGLWLGKTQAQWAEETGARDAAGGLRDPWGLIARQALKDLKAAARDRREAAQIEDALVSELALDDLSWVRTALIDRVGIPEGLLVWPDVAAAAMHAALRLNGFSGEPYNERSLGADWSMSNGMRLGGARRALLIALQPFIDRQRRDEILMGVLLALAHDECSWLEDRIDLVERTLGDTRRSATLEEDNAGDASVLSTGTRRAASRSAPGLDAVPGPPNAEVAWQPLEGVRLAWSRKLLLRLLRPFTERQDAANAATSGDIDRLAREVSQLQRRACAIEPSPGSDRETREPRRARDDELRDVPGIGPGVLPGPENPGSEAWLARDGMRLGMLRNAMLGLLRPFVERQNEVNSLRAERIRTSLYEFGVVKRQVQAIEHARESEQCDSLGRGERR